MLIGVDASRAVVAQRTGTEAYSLHLIRGLLKIDTTHHFRLYFNGAPPPGLIPDVAHCEQRVMPFPRLWTHLPLSAEMLRHPPDVLFVPSHVLPLYHPPRSVVTVHDLGYRIYPEAHTAGQRRYLEWSTRYHTRAAAHLLVDSQATADDLANLYGADPARMTVVHLGVDPALRPVRDPAALETAARKAGIRGPYLLYVGTLQPRKNLVRLIEAFASLCAQRQDVNPEAQLVLAGKRGWLYRDILSRAHELGIGDRVVFPGYVEDADLAALYSAAALFVMPSLYEGFCMPVLEAMACGIPVVCSSTSSLPEVVGDAALTFDPLDTAAMAAQIERALADAEHRARLVERGFERVKRFTWERCARQVLQVLERVGRSGSARTRTVG